MSEKLNKQPTKQPANLKSKALAFLSRREYAYHELFTKLQRYTDNLDEINFVLAELQKKGWLSEERYVNSYIGSKVNRYGSKKIRYNLLQKQVDPNLIDKAFKTTEYNESKEKVRQIRFLLNRGFSYDVIMRIIK